MRTLFLAALATFPATALAWDSVTEDVQFVGDAKMFEGTEWSGWLPSQDAVIAVGFEADTDAVVAFEMLADSELTWPEALTHAWDGVMRGGLATLETDLELAALLKLDLSIIGLNNVTVPLWERTWEWTGSQEFDSLLLPGGLNATTVTIAATELAGLDYTFALNSDVDVTIGGDLMPTATATLTGTRVVTNQTSEILERDGTAMVAVPLVNEGSVELRSTWDGDATGTFGLELVPWVEVCIDGFACIYLDPIHFPWTLAEDATLIGSDPAVFAHDLPAIGVRNAIDLGTLYVGETVELDVVVENLGAIDLEGDATYTGDAAIRLTDASFLASTDYPDQVTLSFTPESEGSFSGTLTITSNDPVAPELQIPVLGTAELEPIDDNPGDDPDVDGDGEGDLGAARGCACNAVPTPAPAGVMGLFGLFGLLLRRRR